MNEVVAFGKSKAELGSILDSISSHTDKNHPASNEKNNTFEFLEEGMEKLSQCSEAKETFRITL